MLRGQTPTYERLQQRLAEDGQEEPQAPVTLHCGWGRILIGNTYSDPEKLAADLLHEQAGERDIALYVAAPHQVLAYAPQQLFLDPSDTSRIWFTDYRPARRSFRGFDFRTISPKGIRNDTGEVGDDPVTVTASASRALTMRTPRFAMSSMAPSRCSHCRSSCASSVSGRSCRRCCKIRI